MQVSNRYHARKYSLRAHGSRCALKKMLQKQMGRNSYTFCYAIWRIPIGAAEFLYLNLILILVVIKINNMQQLKVQTDDVTLNVQKLF